MKLTISQKKLVKEYANKLVGKKKLNESAYSNNAINQFFKEIETYDNDDMYNIFVDLSHYYIQNSDVLDNLNAKGIATHLKEIAKLISARTGN